MNCFNHPDRPSIGMCKSYCRGLCRECALELENGLACKEAQCEDRVKIMNKLLSSQTRILAAARSQSWTQAVLLVAMGAILLGFGLLVLSWGMTELGALMGAMGAVMLIAGFFRMRAHASFPKLETPKEPHDPFAQPASPWPPGR
jgi:hypothetical protein